MALNFYEPVMKWKAPSSFQENKRQFYTLVCACIAGIIICIFAIKFIPTAPGQSGVGAIIVVPCFGLLMLLIFFYRSPVILTEDGIMAEKQAVRYDEIESCRIKLLSYPDLEYHALLFTIKDPNKFRISAPLGGIMVPQEVNLKQVLDFLKNKGVKVIENHTEPSS